MLYDDLSLTGYCEIRFELRHAGFGSNVEQK